MAIYIKVRPIVAEMIGLADIRPKTADGNYTLWANDLSRLGRVADYRELVKAIGGVCLHSSDVALEQRGKLATPLPEITDERIRVWAAEREAQKEEDAQDLHPEDGALQHDPDVPQAVDGDDDGDVDGEQEPEDGKEVSDARG